MKQGRCPDCKQVVNQKTAHTHWLNECPKKNMR